MGKKGSAVALPELLDLIEHCREALDPALWHLIENGAESGDGATDARYPVLDPALDRVRRLRRVPNGGHHE